MNDIKVGRKMGYAEYNRRWKSFISNNFGGDMTGNIVSPKGILWRPAGKHYPGLLLINWTTNRRHSIDYGTLWYMFSHGWIWRPDNIGNVPKFTITKWPDGIHYYLLDERGDLIKSKDREKFNTWTEAWNAGNFWANTLRH
jgi:hypothetical protein